MKKGYKRLLIFSFLLTAILLINTFIVNYLSKYTMVLFLAILIFIFKVRFVLEKDNHRYMKDIFFELFLYIMMFFILFYLLGLVVGLTKPANYYSLKALVNIIIPLILYIILREYFRYNMLSKADGNLFCTVLVVILFILMDISDSFYYTKFDSQYAVLKFIAISLFPTISKNISYTFVSKKMGYKPVIVFDLIITLYAYLLPLIPNPSEYVMSIILLIVPILFAVRIINFFERRKDYKIPSDYHKVKFKGMLVPMIIIMALTYFYSGYFRFYAIAIASGSMTPEILKGDVVIVDQKLPHKQLELEDVIAYRKEDIIVVHRLVKRLEVGGEYIYYTKGDANSNIDDIMIKDDMIIGKVVKRIPYVGLPTVWFNDK